MCTKQICDHVLQRLCTCRVNRTFEAHFSLTASIGEKNQPGITPDNVSDCLCSLQNKWAGRDSPSVTELELYKVVGRSGRQWHWCTLGFRLSAGWAACPLTAADYQPHPECRDTETDRQALRLLLPGISCTEPLKCSTPRLQSPDCFPHCCLVGTQSAAANFAKWLKNWCVWSSVSDKDRAAEFHWQWTVWVCQHCVESWSIVTLVLVSNGNVAECVWGHSLLPRL